MALEHGRKLGEIGSVSWGTHCPGDLIDAFSAALAELWPSKATELEKSPEYAPVYAYMKSPEYDGDAWFESAPEVHDSAYYLLEELFDRLEECAPNRAYFGAHPGDGSDFGYWYDCECCEFWADCPYCQGRTDTCPHKDD